MPPGTALTHQTSTYIIVTTPGTVIDGWDAPGQIEVRANNVTIKNTRVHCAPDFCIHSLLGVTGLKVSHSDLGPDTGYIAALGLCSESTGPVTANTFDHLHIHNVMDGVRVDGGFTLADSYVHNLDMTNDGAHSDGVQTLGGDNALIQHNTIEGGNTSGILVQGGRSSNWVIAGNQILGRLASNGDITTFAIGFDVNSCPNGGCLFHDNVVNRTWQSGVSYVPTIYTGLTWYNNHFLDNGATVPVP